MLSGECRGICTAFAIRAVTAAVIGTSEQDKFTEPCTHNPTAGLSQKMNQGKERTPNLTKIQGLKLHSSTRESLRVKSLRSHLNTVVNHINTNTPGQA